MTLGKPALLFEGGEANRLDQGVIDEGVQGTLRVMAEVGLIARAQPGVARGQTSILRSCSWLRATHGGFCRMRLRLGDWVTKGEVVADIVDPTGGTRMEVKAKRTGVAIGMLVDGLVTAGEALLHVAETRARAV
jgi:hypothetical protein